MGPPGAGRGLLGSCGPGSGGGSVRKRVQRLPRLVADVSFSIGLVRVHGRSRRGRRDLSLRRTGLGPRVVRASPLLLFLALPLPGNRLRGGAGANRVRKQVLLEGKNGINEVVVTRVANE